MFTNKNLYHIGAWILFMGYECALAYIVAQSREYWEPFAFYVTDILLFYAFLAMLRKYGDGLLKKGNWRIFLPFSLLLLLIFTAINFEMRMVFNEWKKRLNPPHYQRIYIGTIVFRCIYLMLLSYALWLIETMFRKNRLILEEQLKVKEQQIKVMELEQAFVLSQNELYKAKIKPHILFNTLNFLHSTVLFDETASTSVLLLTDIMRFALAPSDQNGLIVIEEEWRQVINYLTLQKLRFDKPPVIHTAFVNRKPGTRIPPLVVLTLVENMFMHGNLFDEGQPAHLQLMAGETGWEIKIFNQKKDHTFKTENHGIGLKNILGRLQFFYGHEAVSFQTNDASDPDYELYLKIDYRKTKPEANDLLHN